MPLPDYCANDSSVVVNVATSIHDSMEYSGQTGLYVSVQGVNMYVVCSSLGVNMCILCVGVNENIQDRQGYM